MSTNNAINNTLPSPFTLGATSVTSTGTQLNLLNGLTVVPINKVVVQTFTANGTYTPTAGMVYCIIECVGGGGGGGGTSNSAAGSAGCAASGGSGAYSRKYATAADIGASKAVTVGTGGTGGANTNGNGNSGGDTSVGTLCVAKGGGGGPGTSGTASAGQGGAAASGTGDVLLNGRNGSNGNSQSILTVLLAVSPPGNSIFGGGYGAFNSGTTLSAPGAPSGYGNGGRPGITWNAGGAATGGAGSDGYVAITEFLSA